MKDYILLKRLFSLSLILLMKSMSYGNTSKTKQADVLELVVTSNTTTGPGSLKDIITQANSSTEDVNITFNLTSNTVYNVLVLTINNVNGKSVTIDGANKGSNIVLDVGAIKIFSSNVSISHVNINTSGFGFRVESGAEDVTISHCTLSDINNGIILFGDQINVDHVTTINVFNGIRFYGDGLTLGEGNNLQGNGVSQSTGIWIHPGASNVVLGGQSGIRDNYTFIGGFFYGIRLYEPSLIREMIIGGKKTPTDYCGTTETYLTNTIGIRVEDALGTETNKTIIGEATEVTNVIITGSKTSGIDLKNSDYVDVNNTFLGVDPAWCNHQVPSDIPLKATYGILVYDSRDVNIGLQSGNVFGQLNTGIAVASSTNSTNLTKDVQIKNNKIGVDKEWNNYSLSTGISLSKSYDIKIGDNILGNYSAQGIYLLNGERVSVKRNYLGITTFSAEDIGGELGIRLDRTKESIIDGNFFGYNDQEIFVLRTEDLAIVNNVFGALYDKTPLVNTTGKYAIEVRENCLNVEVGLPNQGNQFIGRYDYGVSFVHYDPAVWNDSDGFSTGEVHSNIFKDIRLYAINVGIYYHVKVGQKDNPSSGNEILNANTAIVSYSNATTVYRVLEAYNNLIGIDRNGNQGTLQRGVDIGKYTVDDQYVLENNRITNCSVNGIKIAGLKHVQMSKNLVYGNTENIRLNGATNIVNGSIVETNTISGFIEGTSNYMLSGITYIYGEVDIFRQKEGEIGTSEFVGTTIADQFGYWQYRDNLFKQKSYDGYMIQVTVKENINGVDAYKTSKHSQLFPLCVTTDDTNTDGCLLISEGMEYSHLTYSKTPSIQYVTGDNLYFFDKNLDLETYKIKIYNSLHEIIDSEVIEVDNHRFLLPLNDFSFESPDDIYSLEAKSRNGNIKRLRFTK